MIEALKSDEIVHKVGGRFKLTALIQKRMLELMDGARPLVDRENLTDLAVNVSLSEGLLLDREENISAFGHDRLAGINDDFGASQSRAVDLPEIGTMRAHRVYMRPGPERLGV